ICRFIAARQPLNLSARAQLLDARYRVRSNYANRSSAAQQAFDLLQANQAGTDNQASLPFQLQKQWKETRTLTQGVYPQQEQHPGVQARVFRRRAARATFRRWNVQS